MKKILIVSLLSMASISQANETKTVVLSNSDWTATKTVNSMTDKVSCYIINNRDRNIQAGSDSFYIGRSGQGNVAGYQYRLDTDTPASYMLASRLEKDISAIIIPVDKLEGKNRIRVSGLSILRTSIDVDIDISKLGPAVDACKNVK